MAAQPPELFRGTATEYIKYRPLYPPGLIPLLVERFHLDGSGTLLDLGCGPGVLTVPLRPYFATVYGLDPQPEMLEQARVQARTAGVDGIRWILGSSADLPHIKEELGSLRLVTMGRSFHWTDRPATLDALYDMVEPGGGVAIIGSIGFWDSEAP